MSVFTQIWEQLSRNARIALLTGSAILAVLVIALSFWLMRPDYQVLFGNLSSSDAAAMTAALDKLKIPYQLADGGNTIEVPADQVYKTRLKLINSDVPLHGTVGFELFNNADIGMTEFAQKVNYQRALQGELARTIMSYEEIQGARVHLALPEHTLFRDADKQAKASVSLILKPGKTLMPAEVQGIQRLIAASVDDMRPQDVTIIDQHGIALTPRSGSADAADMSADLDGKQALEHYLTHKVMAVLDNTFGRGQCIASVNVMFNRNAVKTTTERVLGADNGNAPVGVVVHEHHTSSDTLAPGQAVMPTTPLHPGTATDSSKDVDYQVGRQVEQVVAQPGAVQRIDVAVVIRAPLDADALNHVRDIVAMSAGVNRARGDEISIYTMAQLGATAPANPITTPAESGSASPPASATPTPVFPHRPWLPGVMPIVMPILAALALAMFFAMAILMLRTGKQPAQPPALSLRERQEVLARIRDWLDDPHENPEGLT